MFMLMIWNKIEKRSRWREKHTRIGSKIINIIKERRVYRDWTQNLYMFDLTIWPIHVFKSFLLWVSLILDLSFYRFNPQTFNNQTKFLTQAELKNLHPKIFKFSFQIWSHLQNIIHKKITLLNKANKSQQRL